MRGVPVLVLALVLLAPTTGLAGTRGADQTRTVEALLAAPAGIDDRHVWHVDVPSGATVTLLAEGTATSPFLLQHHRLGEPAPVFDRAGIRASLTLPGPATWRVVLDPVGGGPVRVDLLFSGRHAVPEGTAPAEFTLVDVRRGDACLADPAKGCLP